MGCGGMLDSINPIEIKIYAALGFNLGRIMRVSNSPRFQPGDGKSV
jgi:hypothetical protein